MRSGAIRNRNGNINSITGDEATRSRDNHSLRRLARFRPREQHAQRVALIEMTEPGYSSAIGETNFSGAVH